MIYFLWFIATLVLLLSIVFFVPGAMAFVNPTFKSQKNIDYWSNRFLNSFLKILFIYPIFFFSGFFFSLFYNCVTIYYLVGYIVLLFILFVTWFVLERFNQ